MENINFIENLKKVLSDILTDKFCLTVLETEFIELSIPTEAKFGDYTTNLAMKLTKLLHKAPREIAMDLEKSLESKKEELFIEKIEIVGPGFMNFFLAKDYFVKRLNYILENKNFGKSDYGKGKKVMIEFGQPNTHKAFHVGHLKSAISGLSMVKLHENLGFEVIKVNFYGDVGMQVAKPTWAFMKKGEPKDFEKWNVHDQMKYIDECYAYGSKEFKENPNAEAEIRQINKDVYAETKNESTKTYEYLKKISLKHQHDVWKNLGIEYDREYPESEVYKEALKLVKEYKDEVFEESEGAIIYRGEKEGLTNWVFLTSEGNPTYSSKDLALANLKFKEHPDLYKGIVTTSVEIKDYFKVVIHVLGIIHPETKGRYFHIPFGWMLRGGKKFSSRMGGSVKGMDILDEVKTVATQKIKDAKDYDDSEVEEIASVIANAGLKFLILSHEFHKDFSYDPEQFLNLEGFSGPYILYSLVRAKSIISKVDGSRKDVKLNMDNNKLNESELGLLKQLDSYEETCINGCMNIAPHLICLKLYEIAGSFNSFYAKHQVINEEDLEVRDLRIGLVLAVSKVLTHGLLLLGIESDIDKM